MDKIYSRSALSCRKQSYNRKPSLTYTITFPQKLTIIRIIDFWAGPEWIQSKIIEMALGNRRFPVKCEIRTLFLQNTGGCFCSWPDGEVLKLFLFLNWFEIKIGLIWKALEYENKSNFLKLILKIVAFRFFLIFYFILFYFFHFCFTRLIKFTNDNSRQPYCTFLKVH